IRFALSIFAMHVADPVLWEQLVSVRIWDLTAHRSIAWVPIPHKISRLHRVERARQFRAGCGVASMFVFKNTDDALLAAFFGNLAQLVIYRRAIGCLVVEPPEVKAAHAVSAEGFRHRDAALQYF